MGAEWADSERMDIDEVNITFTVEGREEGSWTYRYGIPESTGNCLDLALAEFAKEWPELLDLPIVVTLRGDRLRFRRLFQDGLRGGQERADE